MLVEDFLDLPESEKSCQGTRAWKGEFSSSLSANPSLCRALVSAWLRRLFYGLVDKGSQRDGGTSAVGQWVLDPLDWLGLDEFIDMESVEMIRSATPWNGDTTAVPVDTVPAPFLPRLLLTVFPVHCSSWNWLPK